jgi:cell division protein FtsL
MLDTILLILAFAAGLTVGIVYHHIAAQDWREEIRECDTAIGFWQQCALALEQRIRELEQAQPRVAIVPGVGFVRVEGKR